MSDPMLSVGTCTDANLVDHRNLDVYTETVRLEPIQDWTFHKAVLNGFPSLPPALSHVVFYIVLPDISLSMA